MIFGGYSQAQVDGLLAAKDQVIALQEREITRLSTLAQGLEQSNNKLAADLTAKPAEPPPAPDALPPAVVRALQRHIVGKPVMAVRAAYAKAHKSWQDGLLRGLANEDYATNLANDILRGDNAQLVDEWGTVTL